jgi:hypothetical protein
VKGGAPILVDDTPDGIGFPLEYAPGMFYTDDDRLVTEPIYFVRLDDRHSWYLAGEIEVLE